MSDDHPANNCPYAGVEGAAVAPPTTHEAWR